MTEQIIINSRLLRTAILAPAFTGCATLPDASVNYYLPKSETEITVTQTIVCDPSGYPNVTNALSAKTKYSADYDYKKSGFQLSLKGLDGAFSDTDVTVSLTEDGRLSGINSSQTGQAEPIIKAAVATGLSLATLAAAPLVGGAAPWCSQPAAKKPVTITYLAGPLGGVALATTTTKNIPLDVDLASAAIYSQVSGSSDFAKDLAPELFVGVGHQSKSISEEAYVDGVPVTLPIIQRIPLTLRWGKDNGGNALTVATQSLDLPVESGERSYDIHIPTSAMFGTQKFVLALADSGAVTKVQYVKDTGLANGFSASQDVISPLKRKTVADEANELKAQADLIVQQQRLAACKANPSSCK